MISFQQNIGWPVVAPARFQLQRARPRMPKRRSLNRIIQSHFYSSVIARHKLSNASSKIACQKCNPLYRATSQWRFVSSWDFSPNLNDQTETAEHADRSRLRTPESRAWAEKDSEPVNTVLGLGHTIRERASDEWVRYLWGGWVVR